MALVNEVNIELGDDMSKIFDQAAKLTYDNRPGLVRREHESFSGFRGLKGEYFAKYIADLTLGLGFDGVGTKVEVAERLNDHLGTAFDLFAMACDDAVVRGAETVALGSIVDVRELDEDSEVIKNGMRQLAQGMVGAAKAANVVVINGEIAELGYRISGYGDFNYNWGAGVLWLAHEDRLLTGREIKEGNTLIGLAETGFRSNGITDVRNAMLEHYGPDWHNQVEPSLGSVSLGRQVQKPSIIYSGFVNELTGGFDIDKEPKAKVTGVAHITGGGQPSKLGRMLEPSGLGVTIDNPIEPPEIMLHVQKLRSFDDKKAYGKWHMGSGMIIATPEPGKVVDAAKAYGIEAQIIGTVTDTPTDTPSIRIRNRGAIQKEEWLWF